MKTYKQLLEENKSNKSLSQVEELEEIKLATVGKIIKHSPKIASAAIGAAVAAHSVDVPKQPVKASYSEFTKKIQKEEYIEESHEELDKHISVFSKGIKSSKAQHSTYKSGGGKINNMKNVSTDASHQDIFNHLKKMGYKKTSGYDPKPNQFDMHHNSDTMTTRSEPIHHPSGVSAHVEQEHGGSTKVHFTHRNIKEEVESLDELSKKTLGSYVKQASQSAQALATTAMHQRHQSDAHYANGDKKKSAEFGKYSFDSTERQLKRDKGIKKAVDKLTKEEVESLDEGSFKYHMDKAVEADTRGDTKKKEYHLANAKTARYAVPTSAYPKHKELFDKYKKMTEEVEQIDELSKKTLGSYVKKATGGLNGVAHHAFNANEKIGRDSDDRAKSYSKAVKRIKGVEHATDKLTKEEVELTEGKIPVEHAANSVGKVLGQHNAVKFLAHLKPGTEKHTSWDKINTALKSQGVQTHHIAKIAGHIKPVQFKEEVELDEVLDPSTGAGEYVKDFQKSDAPQFKGKSQEKRRIMGIAAYMAAKNK